jgi:hypothetical protein
MTFEKAIDTIKAGIWSLSFWHFRDRDKVVIRTDDDGNGNEEQVAIEIGDGYTIEKVPGGFEVQIFIPCYSYDDGEQGDIATLDTFPDLAKAVAFLLMLPAKTELECFFEDAAINEVAAELGF